MYIDICIIIYIYMHAYVYVHVHVHVDVDVDVDVDVCAYVYVYEYSTLRLPSPLRAPRVSSRARSSFSPSCFSLLPSPPARGQAAREAHELGLSISLSSRLRPKNHLASSENELEFDTEGCASH